MKTIKTFDQFVKTVKSSEAPLFIRYSKGPAADQKSGFQSKNNANFSQSEGGLSVNNLTPKYPECQAQDRNFIAQQLAEYSFISGAKPWLLSGDVTHFGGDNEPILDPETITPMAWIGDAAIQEAKAIYQIEQIRYHASMGILHYQKQAHQQGIDYEPIGPQAENNKKRIETA